MKKENFNKALEELRTTQVSMTESESGDMLAQILSTPIPSPYSHGVLSRFAAVSRMQLGVLSLLIFTLSFGGVVYAFESSLPGDLLYPVKIAVVEPVLNVVNRAPEKRVVWEEEKVTRRIKEADALAKEDKLDDKKLEELESKVRKSSQAFVSAVEDEDKEQDEKEKRKDEFKKKIEDDDKDDNEDDEDDDKDKSEERRDQKERVKKIKDTAIKTLDDEKDKNKSSNKKNKK